MKIKVVGDPNELIEKVTDAHIARFPREWEAFSAGTKELDIGGTPLTEIPGFSADLAKTYRIKGVRNAEDLAALTDMACSRLGMGALTHRTNAQNMLKVRAMEAQQTVLEVAQERKKPGPKPKVPEAA